MSKFLTSYAGVCKTPKGFKLSSFFCTKRRNGFFFFFDVSNTFFIWRFFRMNKLIIHFDIIPILSFSSTFPLLLRRRAPLSMQKLLPPFIELGRKISIHSEAPPTKSSSFISIFSFTGNWLAFSIHPLFLQWFSFCEEFYHLLGIEWFCLKISFCTGRKKLPSRHAMTMSSVHWFVEPINLTIQCVNYKLGS